jgi:hypothetical protein
VAELTVAVRVRFSPLQKWKLVGLAEREGCNEGELLRRLVEREWVREQGLGLPDRVLGKG